ncbi:MAG: PIG-L deacetylase family protein [Planctomycetota bacterium]|jgi:LmbE family N-acetylglucosaminyl deacetylase
MSTTRPRICHGSTCSHDLVTSLGTGPWLAISPHDDDAILGMGATLAAAAAVGIEIHLCVVTDGRMGYSTLDQADSIVAVRRAETEDAMADLGVSSERIHWLGFADGNTNRDRGARPDSEGSGIGRALTQVMRTVGPGAVFVANGADLHPDHQVVAAETAMAVCWAAAPNWLELGPAIDTPRLWSYAVYCDFPQAPSHQVATSSAHLAAKVGSLRRFVSQPFIDDMIARISADGPIEYFDDLNWQPYRPASYHHLFPAFDEVSDD